MYLKYLELNGFKSFPDKTKLNFGRGITAVVGPNGSGKSNISDAVRWVFGEQSTKALRGAKMEDVIFNGTAIRHAHGFAEVKLALDNTDHSLSIDQDEVVITRKYYRNGESEYKICDAPARLRDVNELFMDTGLGRDGYSLIGQGRISEIVGAKPTQRREIFEEASGISKFRYRKEEAERNLERADDNLLRLRDNLSALEERVGPLLEQSEKAKQFLELAEEKKSLEISVWMRTLKRLKTQLSEQKSTIDIYENEYNSIDSEYQKAEDQINALYEYIRNIDADVESKRSEISNNDLQISELTAKSAVFKNDIEHNNQEIERLSKEIDELSKESDTSAIDEKNKILEEKNKELENLFSSLTKIEETGNQLNSEKDSILSEKKEKEESLTSIDADLNHIGVVLATAQNDIEQYNDRINQLSLSADKKASMIDEYESQLKNVEDLIHEIEEKDESLNNSINGLTLKRSMKANNLTSMEEKREKLQKEAEGYTSKAKLLEDLEKHMDGFAQSVKFVLDKGTEGRLRGILDPVSKIISVDSKYSLAIETAASAALQNIVVTDEDAAKKAINLLKSEGRGRVTFLPLTSVKGNILTENGLSSCDGFIGIASELIKNDSRYDGIIKNIFGRICIAEDLDSAVSIAKKYGYKFKIVTLDGQVINAGGSLTGGSTVKSAGILSRKQEIDSLLQKAEQIELQLKDSSKEYNALKEELSSLDAQLLAFNSELRTISEDKIRCESEIKHLNIELSDAKSAGDEVQSQKKILDQAILDANSRINEFNSLLNEKKNAKASILDLIENIQKRFDDNGILLFHNNEQSNELNTKIALLKQGIENIKINIEELMQSHDERLNKISNLSEQSKNASLQNDQLTNEIASIEEQIQSLSSISANSKTEIDELFEKRKEFDLRTTQERQGQKDLVNKREESSIKLTRARSRMDDMQKDYDNTIGQLWDEYEMTYSMAEEIAEEITEPQKAQKRLNELRSKIKGLGPVNVGAIEEFREVSERYEFMKSQITDAEKSRDELRNLIHSLMSQMKTIFSDRFTLIAANFTVVFKDLFGGGEGKLVLTDPDNVLDSGIDIIVHPPGKIINNLSSLSGGEQTLVAIAIYFAILKVRPAPFCILDEIEAALDESNVDRYAEYMLTLISDTQFIAITHRRGTMEHADRLYGVTMQEEGVSKLLELSLADVDKIEK